MPNAYFLLQFLIFRPCNDLILNIFSKFDPVLGKTGNPDEQAAEFIGFCLCLFQHPRIDNIELHMESAFVAYKHGSFRGICVEPSLPFNDRWVYLQIQLGILRLGMIPAGGRIEQCIWPMLVSTRIS